MKTGRVGGSLGTKEAKRSQEKVVQRLERQRGKRGKPGIGEGQRQASSRQKEVVKTVRGRAREGVESNWREGSLEKQVGKNRLRKMEAGTEEEKL